MGATVTPRLNACACVGGCQLWASVERLWTKQMSLCVCVYLLFCIIYLLYIRTVYHVIIMRDYRDSILPDMFRIPSHCNTWGLA